MKKTLTRALLLLLITCTLVLTLSSCALFKPKPKTDLTKAAANLEACGYTVTLSTTDNGVGIVKRLYASKVVGDKTEYISMTEWETAKLAKFDHKENKLEYEEELEYGELGLEYAEYMVKKYSHKLTSDELDNYKEALNEGEKEMKEFKEDYSFGRKGKVTWYGTKNAIKATK